MSKRTQKTNSMNLFSTIRLRDLTLKNRIVVSPMQQYSATEGIPGDWHLVHLGGRAIGGARLLLAECNPKERMLPFAVSEGGWQLKSSSATMINEPEQANAIITDGLADLILIAREHLRDPYFSLHAAKILGEEIAIPWQYQRAF